MIFVLTQMQLKSALEKVRDSEKKVDELTRLTTQNTEDISVWKTKSGQFDDLIQEYKVKLGLTPKEAVSAWGNIILRSTRSKEIDRDDLQRPQDTVVLLTPICFSL